MYNLSTVFWFEVIRTLKKKSFWILSLSFPIMAALVIMIVVFANKATNDAIEKASEAKFSLIVTDTGKQINPGLIEAFDAQIVGDAEKAATIQKVKDGAIDAYFYYPKDIAGQAVEVYAKDVGIFDNSKYNSVAKLFLDQSIAGNVSQAQAAVLQETVNYQQTTYRDGAEYDGIKQMIVPGLFLVLFYFLITFFGNQMLTSTTEEKENRVIEMILTTVQARTLIIGKILSLVVLGLLQTLLIITPILIGYWILRDNPAIPQVDLANLPFEWDRIIIGALIFVTSFMLFTGLLVAIGAAVPTAKEAGSFFGIVIMLIFGPLYAAPLFVSSPDSPIVQALSFIPFTAPIPLLLRNAVGNLEFWEAAVAIVILSVTAAVVLSVAVRLFRFGALEYDRRLSLGEIFRPRQ